MRSACIGSAILAGVLAWTAVPAGCVAALGALGAPPRSGVAPAPPAHPAEAAPAAEAQGSGGAPAAAGAGSSPAVVLWLVPGGGGLSAARALQLPGMARAAPRRRGAAAGAAA